MGSPLEGTSLETGRRTSPLDKAHKEPATTCRPADRSASWGSIFEVVFFSKMRVRVKTKMKMKKKLDEVMVGPKGWVGWEMRREKNKKGTKMLKTNKTNYFLIQVDY